MRIISYIFVILVILLGISFACLNAELVNINLYVTKLQIPLSLLLVIVLGLGIFIGFFVTAIKYINLKRENHKLKNKIKWTEKEISNLRSIPLKDDTLYIKK